MKRITILGEHNLFIFNIFDLSSSITKLFRPTVRYHII